ncbi:MAG: TRAP transporter substrate-binding protein [Acuticoccus sp.]
MDKARLLIAAALSAVLAGPAAAATEWTLFTPFNTNDKPTVLYRAFADDVKAATNGELVINVFSGGELPYKNSDVLKALATNQVDIADLAVGPVAGDVPELNVFVLPFICTSMDGYYAAAKQVLPAIDDHLSSKFGVRALTAWTMPPQQIWLKDGVETIGDLSGRKIRTWNRMQVEMLDRLGASSVAITPAEVIPALQRGVVDGAVTAVIPAYDWKFYEVTDFGYMLSFTMTNQLVAVSARSYDALDAATQSALSETIAKWQDRFREEITAAATSAEDNLRKEGMTLIEPSAADVATAREKTAPIWQSWADDNGPVAQDLLTRVSAACSPASN